MKLIYIEWCDATSRHDAWVDIKEAIEWGDNSSWVIKSVGWLLKETNKYILLSARIGKDDAVGLVGGLFKIPKTWILKRKTLTN